MEGVSQESVLGEQNLLVALKDQGGIPVEELGGFGVEVDVALHRSGVVVDRAYQVTLIDIEILELEALLFGLQFVEDHLA